MRRNDRPPISGVMKPMYILQMGWHRMSDQAAAKWLRELRKACLETVDQIDLWFGRKGITK